MQDQLNVVLEALPQPALLLSDGQPTARNAAARRLLGDGALPAGLAEALGLAAGPLSCPWEASDSTLWQAALTPLGEQALLLFQPLPREEEQAVQQAFANLSARLRQLSSALFSASKLLSDQLDSEAPDRERALRYLSYLNQGHYRLRRIIGNLADPSPAVFTVFDLGGFCRDLSRVVTPLAEAAGLGFRYENRVDTQLTAGDLPRLERMLLNLISNAFKFSPPGGLVTFRMAVSGERILLSVSDDGPGIPPEVLSTLFRRWEDWDPSDPGPVGPGLGLPVAHRIARQHGGTLVVESRPGGGVTATVSLPLKQPEETVLRAGATPYAPPAEATRILTELADALPAEVFSPADID